MKGHSKELKFIATVRRKGNKGSFIVTVPGDFIKHGLLKFREEYQFSVSQAPEVKNAEQPE